VKIKHVRLFIIGILLLVVSIISLIIRLNLNKSSELISTQSPNTNEVERTTNHLLPTNSKSSSSLPLARNEGWGTHYRLADCDKLLTYFFENPNNYYGIYDLQEDLGQPGSPDWTSMPWNELRLRYIQRYPQKGEEFIINGETPPIQLSTKDQLAYDTARYRLVLQPKR
tara:strand:+ start:1059 stop:1565 length:507 start_codon:yes stop_codon:yes gene_type:complete